MLRACCYCLRVTARLPSLVEALRAMPLCRARAAREARVRLMLARYAPRAWRMRARYERCCYALKICCCHTLIRHDNATTPARPFSLLPDY